MRKRLFHVPIFHTHNEKKEKKVTWLELFYDLVYVAAFIQLGDAFSKNISIDYFLKSSGIFTSMWLSWTGFTYYANRLTVDDFLHRIFVFIQMFCVGAMAISIPSLLEGSPFAYGVSYSLSVFMISIMYFRAYLQQKTGRDYNKYWGITFFSVGFIWLISLFSFQFFWLGWILGGLIVFISPMTSYAKKLVDYYPLDLEHLAERYGLLTIIVLGESFVKVLTQLTSADSGLFEIIQASFALLLTCSLWWIYFDDVASAHLKKTKNAMVTWLFTHIPLQLSIVFMGVGIKKVVTQPMFEVLPMKYAILLGCAIGFALISTAIIDTVTTRENSELNESTRFNVRIFAGILIILLALVSSSLTNIWFIAACLFVCMFQVIFDIFYSPYDLVDEEEELGFIGKEHTENKSKLENSMTLEPVRRGLPNDFKKDLYFYFIESGWVQLFITVFFIYILSNVLFAGLYLLTPGTIANTDQSFADAFFFSVQTMSTIGYGALAPAGVYSNVIVTIEAAFGLVGVALVTGIIFTKISRPSAKILFSDKMVLSPVDGKNALSFRISNARGNDIVEASVTLSALVDEVTEEGEQMRKIKDLKLVRSRSPFLDCLGLLLMRLMKILLFIILI